MFGRTQPQRVPKTPKVCPVCGSDKIHFHAEGIYDGEEKWLCDSCGHTWDIMPY